MNKWSGQFETDRHIVEYFPKEYVGTAIDVGAVDGRYMSNTLYLEEILGWKVLCIEPNPNYYSMLVNNRKFCENYAISNINSDDVDFTIFEMRDGNQSSVSSLKPDDKLILYHKENYGILFNRNTVKVNARTLDYCLESKFKVDKLDLLSIDTEGTEVDVLRGFDIRKWMPTLIVIEDNWDSSTASTKEYLSQFGYKLDKRVEVNDFFIKG